MKCNNHPRRGRQLKAQALTLSITESWQWPPKSLQALLQQESQTLRSPHMQIAADNSMKTIRSELITFDRSCWGGQHN